MITKLSPGIVKPPVVLLATLELYSRLASMTASKVYVGWVLDGGLLQLQLVT